MINAYIECKTSTKKLKFGATKCKKIHIGKYCEDHKSRPLYVDKCEIVYVCLGEEIMEEKEGKKYLGDVISKDDRIIQKVKAIVNKGKGIIQKVHNILEGIPFGKLYYQVAILLRNSFLVSSLLCNSENWCNLTNLELDLLETVDVMFLRNIFKSPKSTPKEMLFLELGISPLREIIRKRRLTFLQYILKQGKRSMIFKVLEKQCE